MSDIKKFIDIVNENTSGAIATTSMPLGQPIKREQTEDMHSDAPKVLEYGNWENSALSTSDKLKKKRGESKVVKSVYGESKKVNKPAIVKDNEQKISTSQKTDTDVEEDKIFWDADKPAEPWATIDKIAGRSLKNMNEEELDEADLIINPSSISKLSRDLVSKEHDRRDHEVSMALSDLYQAGKNAATVFALLKNVSEEEGIEGWVQEKIIKSADYLNTIREYLEGRQMGIGEDKKPGLWANIHAKRKRIKAGSGERMRTPGSKGAPSDADLKSIRAASKNESIDSSRTTCPECGGLAYENELIAEEKDACYHKVKSRYKVWPSAYASGALVKCRKVGAKNWGSGSKK